VGRANSLPTTTPPAPRSSRLQCSTTTSNKQHYPQNNEIASCSNMKQISLQCRDQLAGDKHKHGLDPFIAVHGYLHSTAQTMQQAGMTYTYQIPHTRPLGISEEIQGTAFDSSSSHLLLQPQHLRHPYTLYNNVTALTSSIAVKSQFLCINFHTTVK